VTPPEQLPEICSCGYLFQKSGRLHPVVVKFLWLLLALSPAVPIVIVVGNDIATGGGAGRVAQFLAFGVNPVLGFIGSYGLLSRRGGSKVLPIIGGIFLGAVFFGINLFVGFLGGCAYSGKSFP